MILKGGSMKIYNVTDTPFAGGGEGSIHAIQGSNSLVAKIYKPAERTRWRREKISGMARESSAFRNAQIAWPLDVLFDTSGFVGFIMQKFRNVDMMSVAFVKKPYSFKDKIGIAISLCKRVAEIHSTNQIIGDLSDTNIGIKDNEVYLFDADSFQFLDFSTKSLYRCCVFTDGFVAPEVLNKMSSSGSIKAMKNTPYSKEADLFVLAIHIFKLLCGSHPFACRTVKMVRKVPSLNDNIKDGYSPFFARRNGFSIPAYSADPHFLPKSIQMLFYKAFVEGYNNPRARPTAKEWLAALRELNSKPVQKCRQNHVYLKDNKGCPFCDAERRTNLKTVQIAAQNAVRRPVKQTQPAAPALVNNSPTKVTPKVTPAKPKPKIKHSFDFWFIVLAVSAVIQTGIIYILCFSPLFGGYNTISGTDVLVQILIFAAGIIGPSIYIKKTRGERVINYLFAILISPVSSVAAIVSIFVLTAGTALAAALAVIAIIIGIVSNC